VAGGHFGPQLQVVERGLVLHGGLNAGKPKRPKKNGGNLCQLCQNRKVLENATRKSPKVRFFVII